MCVWWFFVPGLGLGFRSIGIRVGVGVFERGGSLQGFVGFMKLCAYWL